LQRSLSEITNSSNCLVTKRSWLYDHNPLDQLEEDMKWQLPACPLNPVSQYRLAPGSWFLETQTHDFCCAHYLGLNNPQSYKSSSSLPLDFSNSRVIKQVLEGLSRLQKRAARWGANRSQADSVLIENSRTLCYGKHSAGIIGRRSGLIMIRGLKKTFGSSRSESPQEKPRGFRGNALQFYFASLSSRFVQGRFQGKSQPQFNAAICWARRSIPPRRKQRGSLAFSHDRSVFYWRSEWLNC